ncbi:MAG: sterol desaturase family protein [Isosphaeraceae bacterium]
MNPGYQAFLIDVGRLSIWLLFLVAVFLPLERWFAVRPHRVLRKGALTDLSYYYINNLVPAALLSVPIALLAQLSHQLIPAGFLAWVAGLPLAARLGAAFVAGEFGYYWGHRWCHEVPFLWRFHAIHHSAEEMDFLVHTRAHPFDMAFGRFCGFVPIYVLGLGGPANLEGSLVPVAATLFGTMLGFFIHSNIRWRFGPLERVIATPAFHHWHHTRSGPIDRNFSSSLPWLDWIFGSLYLPAVWPDDYGIREPMPGNLVDQLVHPLFPTSPSPSPEPAPGTESREMAAPSADLPGQSPQPADLANPTSVC